MLKIRQHKKIKGMKKIIIAIGLILLVGAGIMIYKNLKSIENCNIEIYAQTIQSNGQTKIFINNDCGYIFKNVTFKLIKVPPQ